MTVQTVFVVEDEESFVDALTVGLKREGFRVEVARDGAEALERFDAVSPDIVLLDVMLPRVSGIDVCRELRKRSQVPIIMVTAKSAEIDTVVGLEVGADDYITKPYRMRELVARMRAVLRRAPTDRGGELPIGGISVGDVTLDPEQHVVVVRGEVVALPLKEFELLHLLLANAGRVLSRDILIDRVWGTDYVGDTKTLDVHVKRLRARIETDPANPTRIVTIRGLGYKYEKAREQRCPWTPTHRRGPQRRVTAVGDGRSSSARDPGRRITAVPRPAGPAAAGSRAPASGPGSRAGASRATSRRPLDDPRYGQARRRIPLTRFQRLAATHALMTAADAVMLVALASTVLSLDAGAARTKVLAYQLTTLAPFTVLAPLIGPLIDRMAGGRRLVVQIAAVGRVVVSLLLASALHSLLLYPLVLAALILKQTYNVSKSALVPSVATTDHDLVEANSKLGVIAGLAAATAVAPAGILQKFSPRATLVFSALGFAIQFVYATRLPREVVASRRADREEQVELRSPPVVLGASAMVLLRASVGFLQFHLFFWLREEKANAWFGAAIGLSALASMLGNAIGPRIRRALKEEVMLILGLAFVALSGIVSALTGGKMTAMVLMGTVSFGAAIGRLAFDSIVQRDAPAANQGRAFAKFESRFQLAWVLAAIPPVIWTPPSQVGFAVVGAIAAFAAVTYLIGMRAVRQGRPVPVTISRRAGRQIKRRIDERRTPPTGQPRPALPEGRRIVPRPNVPPPNVPPAPGGPDRR